MKRFSSLRSGVYVLLLLSSAILSCKGEASNASESEKFQKKSVFSVASDRTITVYYFHTSYRCYSCKKIEELTKQALVHNFIKQLKSGRIVFKAVNVENTENKHFVQDYQLFTKSVVLVDSIKGKNKNWKRLDQTWSYLGNPGIFEKYIEDEVTAFVNNQI